MPPAILNLFKPPASRPPPSLAASTAAKIKSLQAQLVIASMYHETAQLKKLNQEIAALRSLPNSPAKMLTHPVPLKSIQAKIPKKYAPKPAPSKKPVAVKKPGSVRKPRSTSGGGGSPAGTAGSSAGTGGLSSNGLYGPSNLSSSLTSAFTGPGSPQDVANTELAQLADQTKRQIAAMDAANLASRTAAENWATQAGQNMTNLAGLVGSPVVHDAPGSMGDLPANIAALPGVLSQQALLGAVSSAAHAQNQANMIVPEVIQGGINARGLMYGAEAKAQSAILTELAKENTTLTSAQLAAASRILAGQISAGGSVTRGNIAAQASTANAQTAAASRIAAAQLTAGNTAYNDAATRLQNAWNGTATTPGIASLPAAQQMSRMIGAVTATQLPAAQQFQLLQQFITDPGILLNAQYAHTPFRDATYNASLRFAQSYIAGLKRQTPATTRGPHDIHAIIADGFTKISPRVGVSAAIAMLDHAFGAANVNATPIA